MSRRKRRAKFFDFALSPRAKRRACYLYLSHLIPKGGLISARRALLVYPNGGGFLQLGVLLLEFAGNEAERNALWLREIPSRPFSLCGGVSRRGENILFLRHGRIRCVRRMTRKLVDLRFTADMGRATKVLGKCRAGGK